MSELTDLVNDPRNYDEIKDVYLCFIRCIGEENDGFYRYEFIFTDRIDSVFGDGFDQKPSCLVNDLMVDEQYVTEVHIVKTKIKLELIQDNCCFSVSDCYDGIVSLAWPKNIEENSLYFNFGEDYESVKKKLAEYSILLG